jgi:hypothetical protein
MHFPEQYRYTSQLHQRRRDLAIPQSFVTTLESSPYGGLFLLPRKIGSIGTFFKAIASCSPEAEWEHVSVSPLDTALKRCPTWDEMCFVKDLFWLPEDTVVQFHPPKSEYVNLAAYCLHLWRPISAEVPRPPKILVGF